MNGFVQDRPVVNLLFHLGCADQARSADLHRQLLEMWRWADGKISDCTIAEHHLSGDGFFSTPLDGASMVVISVPFGRLPGSRWQRPDPLGPPPVHWYYHDFRQPLGL
jgi:hypothetical protein